MDRRSNAWWLLLVLLALAAGTAQPAGPAPVDVATLDGEIDFVMAQYMTRAIDTAERDGAQALVIVMDTPGGTSTDMRAIITRMLASHVPIVVYVAPPGARAASAGTFITVAADVAAMAPHTTLGAAHPVSPDGENLPSEMDAKVTNDAVAYIRDLAATHGHNADWAERAVREAVSVDAEEALELGVIDLLASDLDDLLRRMDGRTLTVAGSQVTLHTQGAVRRAIERSIPETMLGVLATPDVAYLLFLVGIIGLAIEFFHPGGWLPGIAGAICLLLALAGFGALPTNWVAVGLIVLAIGLFIADLQVSGFALTIAGIVAFVLGSLLLFDPLPFLPSTAEPVLTGTQLAVSPWLIGGTTLAMVGFFAFGLTYALRARRIPVQTGTQTLAGAQGIAATDIHRTGIVRLRSEEWSAIASTPIARGTRVKVVAVEGLRLRVEAEDEHVKT